MTRDHTLSTTTLRDRRYKIGLLWKEDIVHLPYNRNLAVKRLESIERKLSKKKELADMYREAINGYINEGYPTNLTEKESEISSNIYHTILYWIQTNQTKLKWYTTQALSIKMFVSTMNY